MRSFIVALTAVAACTVSAQTATKKPAARSAAATPVVAPEPAPHAFGTRNRRLSWASSSTSLLTFKNARPRRLGNT